MTEDTEAGHDRDGEADPDPEREWEWDVDLDGAANRALGRAWGDSRPWELFTELLEVEDRMAGRPGERRAADLSADALREVGAREVTRQRFDLPVWHRGRADLAVVDPVERSFRAVALPYSPGGRVEAPLVDAGHGTPGEIEAADVAGAVVLARTNSPNSDRFVHRMEKYGHAVAAGAEGFLFANHTDGQLPPTGSLRFEAEAAVPGVGVSKESGAWLADYAERGGAVRLNVEAHTDPGAGHNAHGLLGPDTTDEIVVLAHHDAHDVGEGALDNGCGVAVVLAAARILGDVDLERRVRIATVGAEEVGLVGARALAADLDPGSVRAVVNVDGAGRHRTLRALTHCTPAFADLAGGVADATDRPVDVAERTHPFSDHWPFLRRGVPAIQLHSVSGEPGRGWGHTEADTREKADSRTIREHGMLLAVLVIALGRAERAPPRVAAADLRAALEERDLRPGMEAAGIWPAEWD